MIKNVIINGALVPVEDLREGKYNKPLPFPKAYLKLLLNERKYEGTISATALINGPMDTFLKFATNWNISPDDSAFMLLGTITHNKIEHFGVITEGKIRIDMNTGIFDLLEEESDMSLTLWDHKTSGSYKVASTIGIDYKLMDTLDNHGEKVIVKGKVKTSKSFFINPLKIDDEDYAMQLNIYRIMIEKILENPQKHYDEGSLDLDTFMKLKNLKGRIINNLKIFFIARDGSTHIAKSRGIINNLYDHQVEILENKKVVDFINKKTSEVKPNLDKFYDTIYNFEDSTPAQKLAHLSDIAPRKCNDHENWDGRKCAGFCPMVKACEAIVEYREVNEKKQLNKEDF